MNKMRKQTESLIKLGWFLDISLKHLIHPMLNI